MTGGSLGALSLATTRCRPAVIASRVGLPDSAHHRWGKTVLDENGELLSAPNYRQIEFQQRHAGRVRRADFFAGARRRGHGEVRLPRWCPLF